MSVACFCVGSMRARIIESHDTYLRPDDRRYQEATRRTDLCLIGIDQNLAQVVGNDIGVAKLAHDSGKPQTCSGRGAQQHTEHGDERDTANRAAATALTGALGIACDIVATVDLGLRTSRGSSGVIR